MHKGLREKLKPGYSGKEVPSLESDIDKRVVELLALIDQYNQKGSSFDFAEVSQYFTLDSLTQIAFGQALGFLTENKDLYSYIKTSQDFFPIMELGCNHPSILKILNTSVMQALAAPKPTDKNGFGAIIGIAHKTVAERFGPDAKQVDDMIGSFVRHGLSQLQCEAETMVLILGGADSTATALRSTLLFILTNPRVYIKLLAEITQAVENGNASFPVIKISEATPLQYLQACIKEGLRMYHPLCGLGSRASPEGVTINDVFIPEGTDVGVSEYGMLRRPDFFGADADTFKPERWIEETDVEKLQMNERTWDLVFGSGRSACLGKNIALMELSKVLFTVSFYFLLCVAVSPPRGDVADIANSSCCETTNSLSSIHSMQCRPIAIQFASRRICCCAHTLGSDWTNYTAPAYYGQFQKLDVVNFDRSVLMKKLKQCDDCQRFPVEIWKGCLTMYTLLLGMQIQYRTFKISA